MTQPSGRSFLNKVATGYLLASSILLGMSGLSAVLLQQRILIANQKTHTRNVSFQLVEILSTLKDIETGQRGYLLTGNPKYLEPYTVAVKAYKQQIQQLQKLDNQYSDKKNILRLEEAIAQKLAVSKKSIDLEAKGDHDLAMQVVLSGQGKRLMDLIRQQIGAMIADNHQQRLKQNIAAAKLDRQLTLCINTGIYLTFIVLSVTFVLVRREIKLRLSVENSLNKLIDDLRETNEELEQFAYIAAHDLQAPLRAIASFMSRLKGRLEGQMDAKSTEYINRSISSANRMKVLLDDLLAYSRVSRNEVQLVPVDLEQIFATVLEDLQSEMPKGTVITGTPLPQVLGDESQLRQLFQNLIGNGLKFQACRRLPKIHVVATKYSDAVWQIAVQDNGIGIEPQYHDTIFKLFQRLHTTSEYEGTGLGLAICKKIVERHQGTIWLESLSGIGTTFYFTLLATDNEFIID